MRMDGVFVPRRKRTWRSGSVPSQPTAEAEGSTCSGFCHSAVWMLRQSCKGAKSQCVYQRERMCQMDINDQEDAKGNGNKLQRLTYCKRRMKERRPSGSQLSNGM